MNRTLLLSLGLALGCSGKPSRPPCAGAACLQVAGTYREAVDWQPAGADAGAICGQVITQLQGQAEAGQVTLAVAQQGSALTVTARQGPLAASGQGTLFDDGSASLAADGQVGDGGAGFVATAHLDVLATFTAEDGGVRLAGTASGRVHVTLSGGGASVDCSLGSRLDGRRE